MFITFEGGEGAGKSTQAKLLNDALQQKGFKVFLTREPGGCNAAESVRKILLSDYNWQAFSELCLISAARQMHVYEVIQPALAEGKTIICDRFIHSTVAYQCYAGGLEKGLVEQFNALATNSLYPDITFFLDIDPAKGLQRTSNIPDHFEDKSLSFHQKLREGFLEMAANDKRIIVIDARQSKEKIHQQILNAVSKYS